MEESKWQDVKAVDHAVAKRRIGTFWFSGLFTSVALQISWLIRDGFVESLPSLATTWGMLIVCALVALVFLSVKKSIEKTGFATNKSSLDKGVAFKRLMRRPHRQGTDEMTAFQWARKTLATGYNADEVMLQKRLAEQSQKQASFSTELPFAYSAHLQGDEDVDMLQILEYRIHDKQLQVRVALEEVAPEDYELAALKAAEYALKAEQMEAEALESIEPLKTEQQLEKEMAYEAELNRDAARSAMTSALTSN